MIKNLIARYDFLNTEIQAAVEIDDISEIEVAARDADKVLDDIIQCQCETIQESQAKFEFLVNLMKLEFFESRKDVMGSELIMMFRNR